MLFKQLSHALKKKLQLYLFIYSHLPYYYIYGIFYFLTVSVRQKRHTFTQLYPRMGIFNLKDKFRIQCHSLFSLVPFFTWRKRAQLKYKVVQKLKMFLI